MDARTLKALKASIAKWERNAVAKTPGGAKVYSDSCPLCKQFADINDTCLGCPVEERTGQQDCRGSPWFAASSARDDWDVEPGDAEARAAFRAAARAEADFLKSLLPPEETK